MFKVKDLNFYYPSHQALKDLSFEIPKNSITALVGPNGAGKTTLMKCLAGIEQPFSGSIHIGGIDVVEEPRRAHTAMGFLPDFLGLYDDLTVAQSLEFFASAHQVTGADKLIAEVLERLNLSDKREANVAELSRGMRQRLALGQALIFQPKMLILDEPASGLDPEARYALGQLFLQLKKEGMTLLVSSHILAELGEYADHMLVLRDGQLMDHRALGKASSHKEVFVKLSKALSKTAREALEKHAAIEKVRGTGTKIHLDVDTKVKLDALLVDLIKMKLPVVGFGEVQANIQDDYLKIIQS